MGWLPNKGCPPKQATADLNPDERESSFGLIEAQLGAELVPIAVEQRF
jgi:hypothetical protein